MGGATSAAHQGPKCCCACCWFFLSRLAILDHGRGPHRARASETKRCPSAPPSCLPVPPALSAVCPVPVCALSGLAGGLVGSCLDLAFVWRNCWSTTVVRFLTVDQLSLPPAYVQHAGSLSFLNTITRQAKYNVTERRINTYTGTNTNTGLNFGTIWSRALPCPCHAFLVNA